jgi:hypothetical protein
MTDDEEAAAQLFDEPADELPALTPEEALALLRLLPVISHDPVVAAGRDKIKAIAVRNHVDES